MRIRQYDESGRELLVKAKEILSGFEDFESLATFSGHIARKKFKEITITDLTANQTNYLLIHKNKKLNACQQQAFDLIKKI